MKKAYNDETIRDIMLYLNTHKKNLTKQQQSALWDLENRINKIELFLQSMDLKEDYCRVFDHIYDINGAIKFITKKLIGE